MSETKTIPQLLEQAAQELCEGYCKWPDVCQTQEALDEKCYSCPLVKIF